MRIIRTAVAAAVLLLASAPRAQNQEIDFNLERLRLDPSARGSLLLGDGEVLPGEAARLSATLHFERRPLVVTNDGDLRGRGVFPDREAAFDVVTDRTTLHLAGAVGLLGGIELGLEVPFILDQSGDVANLGRGSAVGAPWIQLRYGATSQKPVAAGVSFAVSPGWGDGTHLNGNKGWSLVPGLELGMRFGGSMFLANLSGLLRTEDVALTNGETLSHEVMAAVGWATTGRPLRFEVTLRTAFDGGLGQNAELLGGVRYQVGPAELYALAGPGFRELPGTPTYRGLAGVALDFGGKPPPKPVAAAPVDPCAPGERHTPAQCPAADDDGDGVANAKDECPLEKGLAATAGCPAKDTDGDGIADHEDRCPAVKGVAEAQGCPPPDSDGDGIADAQDRCPQQPGVPAEQGCPPALAQINVASGKIDITEKVFFDTGKAAIQERSHKLLDDVAALLVANPAVTAVLVEGHTDDRGPAEYNRKLSQERADAVKAYLVGKSVDARRLTAQGFGPDRPAQPNTTAAGREANRRVEFTIQELQKR